MKEVDRHLQDMFTSFFEANKITVIINLSFLFLYPIQDILLPHLYGRVMNNISEGKDVVSDLTIIVFVLVFCQVMSMISDYHNAKLIPLMETHVRSYILEKILDRYETQHEELQVGEIITKIIKIPSVIVRWFDRVKNYIMPYILVYIFAFVYFAYIDIQLALSFVVAITILVVLILSSPNRCGNVSTKRDRSFNEIHKQIDDVLNNLFSIYGGGQKQSEMERLRSVTLEYANNYESTMTCALKHMAVMHPFIIGFIVFFVWRCHSLIESKNMKVSTFISVFIIFLYILDSIIIMNDQLRDIIFEWGMIEASTDILFKGPTDRKNVGQGCVDPYIPQNGLVLNHVDFAYPGNTNTTLHDITLHIPHGQRVCFVGDIGSGKSTIIKLLMKYHLPTSGCIYLDGISYNDICTVNLRRRIGYVPQTPILFNRSVIDNITYGNKKYTRSDVIAIMKNFGVYDEFAQLEKGIDTMIGKNGSRISGGQRQLIWCMRVLLYNPDILILDEPTASIDEKIKGLLHNMLNVIMQDKTVIMVTHDPFLESIATRIITISHGHVQSDQEMTPIHDQNYESTCTSTSRSISL